jgi:hypothetical protein
MHIPNGSYSSQCHRKRLYKEGKACLRSWPQAQGAPCKKKSYTRDDRLAHGGAWLAMAVFFQAPGLPGLLICLVSQLPLRWLLHPPPLAAATASAATAAANVGSDNAGSGMSYCVCINKPSMPVENKGKTPFVCLSGNVWNVMFDKLNKI